MKKEDRASARKSITQYTSKSYTEHLNIFIAVTMAHKRVSFSDKQSQIQQQLLKQIHYILGNKSITNPIYMTS